MSRVHNARAHEYEHEHEDVMGDDTNSLGFPRSTREANQPTLHQPAVTPEILTLGVDEKARTKLAELSGTEPKLCWCPTDDKGPWRDEVDIAKLDRHRPMFITSTWHAPDPDNESVDSNGRLHLASGLWLDIDAKTDRGETISDAIVALGKTASQLQALGIPLDCCSLFASGGKGFHTFIPLELLVPGGVDRVGIITARFFPNVCKSFVMTNLWTAQTDIGIYNGRRGRLFRQPGVQRNNGAYKVPLGWTECQGLTPEGYAELCSAPRPPIPARPIDGIAVRASMAWDKACAEIGKTKIRPQQATKRTRETDFHGNLLPGVRARINKALEALPTDLEYGAWLSVGMALKSTGASNALEIWDTFSRRNRRYQEGECEGRWGGFTGGVTLGTLYHLAKTGGGK